MCDWNKKSGPKDWALVFFLLLFFIAVLVIASGGK